MRIQLGQGSAAQVTSTMLKNEGVAAFYKVFFFCISSHVFLCCFILGVGLVPMWDACCVIGFGMARWCVCCVCFTYMAIDLQVEVDFVYVFARF